MRTRIATLALVVVAAAFTLTGCTHSGPPTIDDCMRINAQRYGKVDPTEEGQRYICQRIKDTSTAERWEELYGG